MIKLNLDHEMFAKDWVTPKEFCLLTADWLTMYAEIERLNNELREQKQKNNDEYAMRLNFQEKLLVMNKAIDVVKGEIDILKNGTFPEGVFSDWFKQGYRNGYSACGIRAMSILRRHLGKE